MQKELSAYKTLTRTEEFLARSTTFEITDSESKADLAFIAASYAAIKKGRECESRLEFLTLDNRKYAYMRSTGDEGTGFEEGYEPKAKKSKSRR